MSDSIISFVPNKFEFQNSKETAIAITEYLIAKKYINHNKKNNTLSNTFGFEPGENYRTILNNKDNFNQVENATVNGVDIISKRTVFHGYGNGLDKIICPICESNLIESVWGEIVNEWLKGGKGNLKCSKCGKNSQLSEFDFHAEENFKWAFSNIGISFYNWPNDFTASFRSELVCLFTAPIVTVYANV